ncbi:hypothetical protein Tsubulata_013832 [Turnera subulata]|uniref:CBS domain-containing protein n=1 Tax=Turnera subulata TaxID=218843 RepID=A0A9Q0GJ69_9ROSI|nr:hypothetical protein Tsubulata_013832 [Turnera subulata]
MAVSLLAQEVSDLCLGKPALRSLSVSATVADALSALRRSGDSHLSVWTCGDYCGGGSGGNTTNKTDVSSECRCIGKICMADVICYLAKPENLQNPAKALQQPVSLLLPKVPGLVSHLEPQASLLEAIDLIREGAQNLVIPIHNRFTRRKLTHKASSNLSLHNNREYCWLTQEDIVRYLLNSIGLFSPTPNHSIESLNIIDSDLILAVHYDDPASSALPLIAKSLLTQTSVAILDSEGRIVGEISPPALNSCEEGMAAAIATLSAGDLMACVECGGGDLPEDLMQLVKERLEERGLGAALELMEEESAMTLWSSSSSLSCSSSLSSSDDESGGSGRSGGRFGGGGHPGRAARNADAVVCHPWSSLVAVMIQALSHRVSYAWVVEEDGTLVGVVTFAGILKVFRERLKPM